jgi:hypothetical protein
MLTPGQNPNIKYFMRNKWPEIFMVTRVIDDLRLFTRFPPLSAKNVIRLYSRCYPINTFNVKFIINVLN